MNPLIAILSGTLALSLLATQAIASSLETVQSPMQHYVFTYHVNKHVDPISHQYNEIRQNINYVLALDIQRQVYRNLDSITTLEQQYLDYLTASVHQTPLDPHASHQHPSRPHPLINSPLAF